jgi:hypothetical protein
LPDPRETNVEATNLETVIENLLDGQFSKLDDFGGRSVVRAAGRRSGRLSCAHRAHRFMPAGSFE